MISRIVSDLVPANRNLNVSRPRLLLIRFIIAEFIFSICALNSVVAENLVSPQEWLARQPSPEFKAGNTLPPLTRYGWSLSAPLRVELAERWGYALSLDGYLTDKIVDQAIGDPQSPNGQIVELIKAYPERYKLSVILSRDMPANAPPDAWVHDQDGEITENPRIWSPISSDQALDLLAEERAEPLRRLVSHVKPAIIINGGEYGVGVIGHLLSKWSKDPAIIAAKGTQDWFEFISNAKAREQRKIRDALVSVDHYPFQYLYYTNGGGPHRGRDGNWRDWEHDYGLMADIGTYPSNSFYYREFNNGWLRGGFKGDLLTQALNAKGREIASGHLFSYDWVSGGWHNKTATAANGAGGTALIDVTPSQQSPIPLYKGFLTCLYLAGTIGVNAGYYAFPTGGFDRRFEDGAPPHWLLQLVATAQVHAIASHIEPFVRNSQLVSGPQKHNWGEFPAYELPTGKLNVRALARIHNQAKAALVVAWAASGGTEQVSIKLEGFGALKLTADEDSNIYLVRSNEEPILLTSEALKTLPETFPDLFR